MKNYILSAIIIATMIACQGNIGFQPYSPSFDFSGEIKSSSSFLIRQKSNNEKIELSIQGDPIALGITKTSKQFDASKLTIKVAEYQNVMPEYSEEFSLFLSGKAKTNPVLKTWTATEGIVTIQLIDGQPVVNKECSNPYTITVKLSNVKFVTSDKKESTTIKSQSFENRRVGWCDL